MFSRLYKRIFNSMLLMVIVFVLLLSSISYFVIVRNMYNSQANRTHQNVQSCLDSGHSYISTVMGFVKNASLNERLIDVVEGDVSDISTSLNSLCNHSVKIDGVILYGYNGYVAYSAGVGSPSTLEELLSNEKIRSFVQSDKDSFVSVRTEALAQVYNYNRYDSRKGIISCIQKVYSGDEDIGLLVADILPETISSLRFNCQSFGVEGEAYLSNGNLLTDDDELAKSFQSEDKNGLSNDKKNYIVTSEMKDGWQVVIYVPQYRFLQISVEIFGVFLVVDIVLILLGVLFARYLSDRLVVPLNNLYKRARTDI